MTEETKVDPWEEKIDFFNARLHEVPPEHKGKISDGYHTFDELYEHRCWLFLRLCIRLHSATVDGRGTPHPVWRARTDSSGGVLPGWFLLGVHKEKGKQITYHMPDSMWSDTWFAETLSKGPEFDGHSSKDVLERIKNLL